MDPSLPHQINYWMTTSSKHDCFFNVGIDNEGAGRERIGAIKVLLMGHSEVFRKMLDSEESALAETSDISVPDSKPETFRNFLKCVYGGTEIMIRKLSFAQSIHIYYLCEKYMVTDVKHKIISSLLETHSPLSLDIVFISLFNIVCLESEPFANAVSIFIQANTEQIIHDVRFKRLCTNAVVFIVKQNRISVKEIVLWKALIKWGKKKVKDDRSKDLKSVLQPLIPFIRFCTMRSHDFCSDVVPREVLSSCQISEICHSIGTKTERDIEGICNILDDRHIRFKTGTIHHLLHPISSFSGQSKSQTVEMNGFKWNIMLQTNVEGPEKTLGVFLQCRPLGWIDGFGRPWECCASANLIVINQTGKPHKERNFANHNFSEKEFDWGFKDFMSWEELLNAEFGFVRNNSVEVRVTLELKFR